MPRQPRPWRRGGGPWYSQVAGEKVWLAPKGATKGEAQKELIRILAAKGRGRPAAGPRLTVKDAIDYYLGYMREAVAKEHRTGESARVYGDFLTSATEAFGDVEVAEVRPKDALAWIEGNPQWGSSTRHQAIKIINIALNWAKQVGHIPVNPLVGTPKPPETTREIIPTAEDCRNIAAEFKDREFLDLLQALRETGCRPKEVWTLTADRVDLQAGTWQVIDKIRGKTRVRHRTIYLTAPMVELSRRLVGTHPEGPIFRNTKGRPWTRQSIAKRLWRVGKRLGIGAAANAYANRHRYATDALVNGVEMATVAALLGHKKTTMLMRVYAKLARETDHMRAAAELARTPVKNAEPASSPEAHR